MGDSWSDGGNFYYLLNKTLPPPYNFENRFSNGPLWVDVIHQYLGDVKQINFAYANATSSSQYRNNTVPGAIQQADSVKRYLNLEWPKKEQRKDILVSFYFGGSDYSLGFASPDLVNENYKVAIELLIENGIQHFLLPKSFNVPMIPHTKYLDPYRLKLYFYIFRLHLIFFDFLLRDLKASHPNVHFYTVDFDEIFKTIIKTPPKEIQKTGGYNLTHPCTLYEEESTNCSNPTSYFFWDLGHGSKRIQRVMGEEMVKVMQLAQPRYFKKDFKLNWGYRWELDRFGIFESSCDSEEMPSHHIMDDDYLVSLKHVRDLVTLSILHNEYN
ncbi:hypothetical protein K502DRAFT_139840 [Neoconidiobolus thromboides FSU 785]|nr:hypothetical protein K502DRAFT_139840 [Neoconidiobolus thromboides FSU 785]